MVKTEMLEIETQGNCHIVDITDQVQVAVSKSQVTNGTVSVFHTGSTAGISTIEYEPGLIKEDINAAMERIAPQAARYAHEETWHDDNGHSHVRATLVGPSLTVPFCNEKLVLGTWQQIVLIDFDTRPRLRNVVCQIMGE